MEVPAITKIASSLKNTGSYGNDGISVRFLKDSLSVTAFYITIIINTSMATGIVPTSWKHALVVPSHKSKDKDDPSNYRPISLLPIISKIMEKVISEQLSDYLERNNLLSNKQFGFRRKLST